MKRKTYICFDENLLPAADTKNIFQQRAMFRFYSSLKNYKPFFVFTEEENRIIASLLGVIIKEKNIFPSFLASRCLIQGKAEFYSEQTNETEIYDLMLSEIGKKLKNKCLFIEFRHPEKGENLLTVFEKHHYKHYSWYNIKNNLALDNISLSKKRQIKNGLKNGSEIMKAENETQIREFHEILKKLYSKIRKPLPKIDFFIQFFRDFQQTGKGIYLLVKHEKKIIGGIMCLFDEKETIYEWYIGSLHQEYKKLYPGVLSTFAAIEYGKENGFSFFDFMGAGEKNANYSVRDFKLTFGGNLIETSRWQKLNFPLLYKMVIFFNKYF